MTLWIAAAAVAALSTLWLVRPFLARGEIEMTESEGAVSFYRGQLLELGRAEREGLLSADARAEARREVEARAVRAARAFGGGLTVARPAPLTAALLAVALLAGTGGLYAVLGTPGLPDQPIETRRAEALAERATLGDPNARAILEIERLEAEPPGLERDWALGQVYASMGNHTAAAEAYRRAAEASNDAPGVLAAYAEVLTLANGNKVPPLARIVFGQVLEKAPHDPRARYYAALAMAQAQDFEGALAGWHSLYLDTPPGAGWGQRLRQDIVNMARFTGVDLLTLLPDATESEQALAAMQPETGAEGEGARILALRQRLEEGRDWEASLALAGLLAAQEETAEARAVLDAAEAAYAGAPFVLGKIAEARTALVRRGPGAEDIASAAGMSDADRDAMIDGMVAGLAGRLADDPGDAEGWAMLVRSYAVLQRREEALAALEQALTALGPESAAARQLKVEAAGLGLTSERTTQAE